MLNNNTVSIMSYSLTNSIKFAILLALEIPSILISLLIFIYFILHRNARKNKHNHSILVLLVINFLQVLTDLPMPMSYFHLDGIVQPATSAYCSWWTWYEFSLNTVNCFLMAWISIERHLLIFHSNFIRNLTSWKRRVLHIGPLMFCCLWGPLYYFWTIAISPMCTNTRYFNAIFCGIPCYIFTNWGTFDLFVNVFPPILIIFLCNLSLLIRVVYQNLTIRGRVRNDWRRERKMAFQLGMISFVYLAIWIPLSITQFGQIFIDPTFFHQELDTFNFLIYIVPLILPMICSLSMPEVIKTYKQFIFGRQQVRVAPLNKKQIRQNIINQVSKQTLTAKY